MKLVVFFVEFLLFWLLSSIIFIVTLSWPVLTVVGVAWIPAFLLVLLLWLKRT